MKDDRLYARIALTFPEDPKILPLSDAAFRCLVEAICWSREHLTDGVLPKRLASARWSLDVLRELCANDDTNSSLTECETHYLIHDFVNHQDTRADVEARRERARAAGQRGGLAKAKRPAKRPAKQAASKMLSKNVAETETETELVSTNSGSPNGLPPGRNKPPQTPPRGAGRGDQKINGWLNAGTPDTEPAVPW